MKKIVIQQKPQQKKMTKMNQTAGSKKDQLKGK